MQNEQTPPPRKVDCVQYTPLGYFPEEVDFKNLTSNESLLTREKHQLLEGLVTEYVAEQFITTPTLKNLINILDVVTLITRGVPNDRNNTVGQYCSFIWKRDDSDIEDFISILQNLSPGCANTTYICKEEGMKFLAKKPSNSKWLPLQSYLRNKRKITDDKKIKFPQVDNNFKKLRAPAIFNIGPTTPCIQQENYKRCNSSKSIQELHNSTIFSFRLGFRSYFPIPRKALGVRVKTQIPDRQL